VDDVTVYAYEIFDATARRWVTAASMATLAAVQSLHGIPIRSSALVVDGSLVDPRGFLLAQPKTGNGY
jgi:hypothetical protein